MAAPSPALAPAQEMAPPQQPNLLTALPADSVINGCVLPARKHAIDTEQPQSTIPKPNPSKKKVKRERTDKQKELDSMCFYGCNVD